MNRMQRTAKFNLVVILIALVLSVLAVGVFYFVIGLPIRRAIGGLGLMGICGLGGLSPILFKKKPGEVDFDERDLLIQRRALVGAYSIFWALFVLAAMIPFFVLGPGGKVSVWYLAAMVFAGAAVVTLVQSIVTLEMYGWSKKDHE